MPVAPVIKIFSESSIPIVIAHRGGNVKYLIWPKPACRLPRRCGPVPRVVGDNQCLLRLSCRA